MKNHIIKIPHLKAIVTVKKKKKGDRDNAAGYARRVVAGDEYELTLQLPIKGMKTASYLVHELVHILQYIVEDNGMSFTHEREHLAYIADYLFLEICSL
jgi:hypothetical protein